jgi:hypothetical protein
MGRALLFLNSHRAKSGTVDGVSLPRGYVLFAKFFGCGAIDRSETLAIGLPTRVLQPIPSERTSASFEEICGEVARDLVDEAMRRDLALQVAWSGGIDSTVALICLADALRDRGELSRLFVLTSLASIKEYPWFYEHHIVDRLHTRALSGPLPAALRKDAITVTGEHGDQLFGSDHLTTLVQAGASQLPWRHIVPIYAAERLGSEAKAAELMSYLEPQIAQAPVPIETAFDYLWWCNFSLKWQQVSLRVPVFRHGAVRELVDNNRPFFGDSRLQAWSLSNRHQRRVTDWRAYKLESKQLILKATGDFDYFTTKQKAPSLKHVLLDRRAQGETRYRVHMYDDFDVQVEEFQRAQ